MQLLRHSAIVSGISVVLEACISTLVSFFFRMILLVNIEAADQKDYIASFSLSVVENVLPHQHLF